MSTLPTAPPRTQRATERSPDSASGFPAPAPVRCTASACSFPFRMNDSHAVTPAKTGTTRNYRHAGAWAPPDFLHRSYLFSQDSTLRQQWSSGNSGFVQDFGHRTSAVPHASFRVNPPAAGAEPNGTAPDPQPKENSPAAAKHPVSAPIGLSAGRQTDSEFRSRPVPSIGCEAACGLFRVTIPTELPMEHWRWRSPGWPPAAPAPLLPGALRSRPVELHLGPLPLRFDRSAPPACGSLCRGE